jgi:endonuclease/exonuclease/phosphatase family metal-dependent hydrolase
MVFTLKKISSLDKVILVANMPVALILCISYLSTVISPRQFWIISLLGLLYPILLFMNLAFLIYWLIRSKQLALISAAAIILGFEVIMTNFGFRFPSNPNAARPANAIRLMTYNVHGFCGISQKKCIPIQQEVINILKKNSPDIVNLEEFSVNVNTRKAIYDSLTGTLHLRYNNVKQYDYTPWDSTGIAIFSKYPIVNRGCIYSVNTGLPEQQSIYADVKFNTQIVRVYCVHLESVHLGDGEHQFMSDFIHHGKINYHETRVILSKLKASFIKRSYQAETICTNTKNCPYPFIVAGDFNDTPNSFTVTQIKKGLTNAFEEKGSGFGTTYFGDIPHFQIDYIFASKHFKIVDQSIIQKKISDHYPVLSDLMLINSDAGYPKPDF